MVRNITLSADERLIQRARQKASDEKRSLNDLFRGWLAGYVSPADPEKSHDALMRRLGYARPGRRFSRDEMNER